MMRTLNGALFLQIAEKYGTPCYVYDKACILSQISAYQSAFLKNANVKAAHTICYAVKANDNLSILQLMHQQGLGFDVVSGGELRKVMLATQKLGEKPHKVIYSGVGKTVAEISYALNVGIDAFDVESLPELDRIAGLASEKNMVAPISIRFNPNVDAKTHPYISTGMKENKFGLDVDNARQALTKVRDSDALSLVGINTHIGSQITDLSVFENALTEQSRFINECKSKGDVFNHINCGGGLGLAESLSADFCNVTALVEKIRGVYPEEAIIIEPGRSLVARSGYLLMTVEYVKEQAGQTFAIVDAGMNDYMRVALYDAKHEFVNLSQWDAAIQEKSLSDVQVVGPVCESGDFFHKKTKLNVQAGDVLVMFDVGAYGASMGSNYNTRPRPPEVLLDGENVILIRPREEIDSMMQAELACLRQTEK